MSYQGPPQYQGPQYQQGPANPSMYSDWLHRVGAALVEAIPAFVFLVIVILIRSFILDILAYLIVLAYSVYNRWILGGQGQSLGKKVLGMKLVSEQDGQPIGTLNAFLRDVCHFVDGVICYVGYLFPLWDPKRQTLADKIMHTVVVPV